MGDAVVAYNPRLAFHRTLVLEICHLARWPRHLVDEFCQERISADHSMVLYLGGVRRCYPFDTGHMDPLGCALCASFACGCDAFLGRAQRAVFYRRRRG